MERRTLLAIIIMVLASTASFTPLASGHVSTNYVISSSVVMPPNAYANVSTGANYVVFAPQSGPGQNQLAAVLNRLGVDASVSGSLWTFSVGNDAVSQMNASLNRLATEYGISFSEELGNPVVYPSLPNFNITQYTNIPFAYTPSVISRAYDFGWALDHGINGTGQTIVIVDAYGDPNIAYDVKSFDAVTGLPALKLSTVYPLGKPGTYNSTWAMETATDVEWAHAMAPGAKIVLAISASPYTSDLQKVVSYAVQNKLGNIISLSWGSAEQNIGASTVATYSQVYAQAASNGITILAASGDYGAFDSQGQLSVEFPASDPFVTGVGGTSLYVLNNKFQQYGWGGTINNQSYGSGGGYSKIFQTPFWQSSPGFSGNKRGVPDVAMVSDKYTGVYVVTGGGQYMVGGTSVATPIWAAVVALMSQYTGYTFHSVNPLLYQIARTGLYNSSFTQIITGTNGYYQNGPYWNPVTGLGTPKVSGLLNASRDIMKGYGEVDVMNGSPNYNATSVYSELHMTLNRSSLIDNGSTYYYDGFYMGQGNYVKFGVVADSTGDSLRAVVSQNDVLVVRNYSMPGGFGGNLDGFALQVSYSPSSLSFSTTGGFYSEIPVILNYSGEMYPSVGTDQLNSETNLTIINNATFADIRTFESGGWHNATYFYAHPYSGSSIAYFSTIESEAASSNLTFYSSSVPYEGGMGNTSLVGPQILYSLNYGYPLKATFRLQGSGTGISWYVNDSLLQSDHFSFPASGGTFTVSANYTGRLGEPETLNRTFEIPSMIYRNLSVNTTLSDFPVVGTAVTVMWFYSYAHPGNSGLPLANSTNHIGAEAYGFRPYSVDSVFPGNVSIVLSPIEVTVSVFVYPGNASVTMDGKQAPGSGGLHSEQVLPDADLKVNASAPGYVNKTLDLRVNPGTNVSIQTILVPENSSYISVSGHITDHLYSYPIAGAMVQLDNSTFVYTNSSGYYILYVLPSRFTVEATADLYKNYSTALNVSADTVLDIQLSPAEISLTSTDLVRITHYFPLLFYFGFLSWKDYSGGNFSSYQIYVSNRVDFLNAAVTTVSSQNTSYRFLTGLVPGHTYYVSVVLRLSNDQVYQSQVVKITYENPVYLGLNLVILGGIAFYGFVAYRVFRKKDREIRQ